MLLLEHEIMQLSVALTDAAPILSADAHALPRNHMLHLERDLIICGFHCEVHNFAFL